MVRKRDHTTQHSECTNPVNEGNFVISPSNYNSQMGLWLNATKSVLTLFDNNNPLLPFTIPSFVSLSPHWSVIKPFLTYPTVQFTRANLSHPSISQINKNRMITIQRSMITYQNFLRFSPLYLPSPSHTFFIVGLCSARASRVIISPFPFPLSQFPRFVSLRFILRNPLL